MKKIAEEVLGLLKSLDYEKLWKGFEFVNFALYTKEKVISTCKINDHYKKDGNMWIGRVSGEFMGNTAIIINDIPLAIWNMEYTSPEISAEKLSSFIIHESFHSFQFNKLGKKEGKVGEFAAVNYPITYENISNRHRERETLREEKIKDFLNYREYREELIGDFIEYEKYLENLEGLALYVEYKTLCLLTNRDVKDDFIKAFDNFERVIDIRHSCYESGFLIALYLEQLSINWKEDIYEKDMFLSDYLKELVGKKDERLDYSIDNKVKNLINQRRNMINKYIKEFVEKDDRVREEKGIEIIGFNPLKVYKKDKNIYIPDFILYKKNGEEKFKKGPIFVEVEDNLQFPLFIEYLNSKN